MSEQLRMNLQGGSYDYGNVNSSAIRQPISLLPACMPVATKHNAAAPAIQDELIVVTVVFNPRGYRSRIARYNEFEPYMKYSGVKLITVEVSYKSRPFEVTTADEPHHLQLISDCEMWHKERALQLGIQHALKLYPKAKKIAWIDADIKFSNHHWVHDTLMALDHYDFIQPFSQAISLSPTNEQMSCDGSVFYNFVHKIFKAQDVGTFKPNIPLGHPGLAWAATTDALDKVGGLLDICVHGSGDSHMANALMGDIHSYYQKRKASPGLYRYFDAWQARCDAHIKQNVGYVPGIAFHYWHGKMGGRQYKSRWDIVCDHGFDPFTDIYTQANGLYRWAGNKKQMEYDFREAMIARNEDSVDR